MRTAVRVGLPSPTIYYVAREVLGLSREFTGYYPDVDVARVRGNLLSGKGIGEDVILRLLDGIPGINANTIKDQLANLKASGLT